MPSADELKEADRFIPQKIIYHNPDMKFDYTVERMFDAFLKSILNELSFKGDIKYVSDSGYLRYLKYYDLNDLYKISDFYNFTGISASVDLLTDIQHGVNRVTVILNDIVNSTNKSMVFYIEDRGVVGQLEIIKPQLERFITSFFPPFDLISLSDFKPDTESIKRFNYFFTYFYSIRSGFTVKECNTYYPSVFAFGPIISSDFHFKVSGVYFKNDFLFSFAFTDRLNESISFIPEIRIGLTAGGLTGNEIFGFGGGAAVSYSYIYERSGLVSESGNVKRDYSLLYCYLNFLIKPYEELLLSFDFGSFFSISDFSRIYPSYYFPFYLRSTLKYRLYNNLYMEFSLPFSLVNFKTNSGSDRVIANLNIEAGLSFRFNGGGVK